MIDTNDSIRDHVGLTDTFASRRYFRKFEVIKAEQRFTCWCEAIIETQEGNLHGG